MSVTLSGSLLTPVGDIAANAGIRITSLGLGINDLGSGAVTEYQCSPTGTYSLTLVDGHHRIEYRYGQNWIHQGDVVVNADTPAVNTLYELLNATTPVTPEIVQQLQQILTDAEAARDAAQSAEASANASAESLANAVASNSSNAALSFAARRQSNRELYGASRFVHWGKHSETSTTIPINQGMYVKSPTAPVDPGYLLMGRDESLVSSGVSETDSPVVHIAGVLFKIEHLNTDGTYAINRIKFSAAPDGTVTYDSATGAITQHADAAAAFAAETTTNKVVTERYDVPIFEGFKREVKIGSDEVYPNGLIQSQATTMNGISTNAGTRPETFYAAFDGDTGSVGRKLNYFSLSETQQALVLADPWNNFELGSDGKLYQWCLRQKTFTGAGNGNWNSVESADGTFIRFASSGGLLNNYMKPQGMMDTPHDDGVAYPVFTSKDSGVADSGGFSVGAYRAVSSGATFDTQAAVDGECYALVLAQVSRLNRGAYHPSFNPLGAAFLGDTSTGGGREYWYKDSAKPVTTRQECFTEITTQSNGKGFISNLVSGRSDGRFHDAIYADGQGGVIDMRLGGKSLAQFGDDKAALLAGDFRGEEYLPWTWVESVTCDARLDSGNTRIQNNGAQWSHVGTNTSKGDKSSQDAIGYVVGDSGAVYKIVYMLNSGANRFFDLSLEYGIVTSDFTVGSTYHVVIMDKTNLPISGEFTMLDVVGDPSDINNVPDLADGWSGGWINDIPAGSVQNYTLTRKNLTAGFLNEVYTDNDGVNWVTTNNNSAFNSITNRMDNRNWPTTRVSIHAYTAHATVTDPVSRARVSGGADSIVDVTAINWRGYGNNILFKSLLDMININSDSTGEIYPTVKMTQTTITDRNLTGTESDWGELEGSVNYGIQKHESLNLSTPNNGNSALKVLMYPVVLNGQLFIEMTYKQMVHNGASWGDNNQMTIADNDNQGTDLNGETIKYGTHRTGVIGWLI